MSKKLLVHACCGPCLIYPAARLSREFELSVYFFNPNIHPSMEYLRRYEALSDLCRKEGFPLSVGDYRPEEYFSAIPQNEPGRCRRCYRLRLEAATREAIRQDCEVFTTTLSVSPYQDHEALREIGESVGDEAGVRFLYVDFREGFKQGRDKAAEMGLYRQSYCGCLYSEAERYEKRLNRAITGS
ncbi:MAG: epoxyqueuosine reductase QueH [Candidatus Aquicultorales bacterium]